MQASEKPSMLKEGVPRSNDEPGGEKPFYRDIPREAQAALFIRDSSRLQVLELLFTTHQALATALVDIEHL